MRRFAVPVEELGDPGGVQPRKEGPMRVAIGAGLALALTVAAVRRRPAAARPAAATPPRRRGSPRRRSGRRALPAHRAGRPGLQRDPARDRSVLQVRQRHGGINGRKIKIHHPRTTATTRPTRSRSTKQLVLQDKVFAHPRRPRHADPHQGRRLPERLAGAGPVRVLRLPVLERARQAPVHVRLAARLHGRGQDPRPVHRAELRGQEGRLLPAERRLRADGARGLDQYVPAARS